VKCCWGVRGAGRAALLLSFVLAWAGWASPARAASPVVWSAPRLVDRAFSFAGGTSLDVLSCPSVSLCVGIGAGDVLVSTDPGGGALWTASLVDPYELVSLSCPSVSLCVAVDSKGNVLTSTQPSDPSSKAWKTTPVEQGPSFESVPASLGAVSCPTSRLCVAVDDAGNVFTSTDPTGSAGAWKKTRLGIDYPLDKVTCGSISWCVAFGQTGDVITSTDPTGGAAAWTVTPVDPDTYLTALSCPTAWLCVASDENGNVFLATIPAVARSAAITALAAAIDRSCSKQRIARVLTDDGCVTPFTAPGTGAVTITWLSPNGTKIAYGSANAANSGKLAIRVRLTKQGKRLLGKATRRTPIRIDARFIYVRGHRYTRTATIKLTA
jgi:hypothetical protein